ncbi:MAG: hypothetical protein ACKOFV_02070 [Candidatus Nanopelagicaceae bacterium]
MERSIPVEPLKSFDNYRDSLTNLFSANVFYDALKREISLARREGNQVGLVKFILPRDISMEHLLYFSNELLLLARQHDLVSRISEREFVVLLRFDSEVAGACESLIQRVANSERRQFSYSVLVADGTKVLEQVLADLDNPQNLSLSKDT